MSPNDGDLGSMLLCDAEKRVQHRPKRYLKILLKRVSLVAFIKDWLKFLVLAPRQFVSRQKQFQVRCKTLLNPLACIGVERFLLKDFGKIT